MNNSAGVCLVFCGVFLAAVASSGSFNLLRDSADGPGLGFLFSNMTGMNEAMGLMPSSCQQGFLDGTPYFYIYGCIFPATLQRNLTTTRNLGFLFSSDKSLTMRAGTENGLLLANLYPLNVNFMSHDIAVTFGRMARGSEGCQVKGPQAGTPSLVIQCSGGESCEGCLLADFWTWPFTNASLLKREK